MITKESIKNGFPIKALGDVADFLDSQRRPITASDRVPGPYPYYGANGQQDSVADYIFDEPLILLAEDGGLFDEPDRGIAYAIEGKSWVNNHAHVLRPRKGVQIRYLTRVLENYDVNPWITGSTRAKLTKAGASKIQIPLPPLPEQKRIAAILDAADALRAKRRESLAQLDTLLQSTFLDMFGDPVTNPKGWKTLTIANAPLRIGDGNYSSKYPKASDFIDQGVPFIRANNISNNTVHSRDMRFISEDQHSGLKKGHLRMGDVLIITRGDIGKVAIVPQEFNGANINAQLVLLRPKDQTILSAFLCHLLATSSMKRQIKSLETGVALKQLPIHNLKKLSLTLPPVDLQHRFATIVESIERQKSRLRAHLAELDTLFASLQSRAFNGEL